MSTLIVIVMLIGIVLNFAILFNEVSKSPEGSMGIPWKIIALCFVPYLVFYLSMKDSK